MNISEERAMLEAEFAGLKKARGEAMLAGQKFAGQARMDAIAKILEAFTDAEGAQADRDRIEKEEIRQRKKGELQAELAGLWCHEIADYRWLNKFVLNVSERIGRMRARRSRMNKLIPAITGRGVPAPLTAAQLDDEVAMWIAAGLQRAVDPQYNLGRTMRFPAQTRGGLYPAERDWAEIQKRRGQAAIDSVIAGAQPKPKTPALQITHKPEEKIDAGTEPEAA